MAEKEPHFSGEEIAALVEGYAKAKDVLLGNFQTPAGAQLKKAKWEEILNAVNAVGHNNRSLDKVKKKITNMKQTTKAIAVANKKSIKKTGGGPNEEQSLDPIQEKLLSTISQRQISGIEGGLDVHEKKQEIKFPPKEEKPKGIDCDSVKHFKKKL